MPLQGKTALITGSTSGIGLGIAQTLARAGAHIVLNGFGLAEEIDALRADLEKTHGVTVLYDTADMSQPEQISAMIEQAGQRLGAVDILVNNAGIQHMAPIEDFPIEKWDTILAINLSSNFHSIRATVPAMEARSWGRIINVASAHAW